MAPEGGEQRRSEETVGEGDANVDEGALLADGEAGAKSQDQPDALCKDRRGGHQRTFVAAEEEALDLGDATANGGWGD